MKRTFAALIGLSLLLVAGATAQDAEKPLPEWRDVASTRALLWPWFNKTAKRFDIPADGLVQLFAETAKVTVRFDQTALERLPHAALVIADGAEPPGLFDLCQEVLAPRLTLLPDGPRAFAVCSPGEINARAGTIKEDDAAVPADGEWVFCVLALGGRDARTIERGLSGLRSPSGRTEIVDDGRGLLVLDTGANLRRMRELIPSLDRARDHVPLVPYQRASKINLGKLVTNLRAVVKLFARHSGIDEDRVHLAWEDHTGIVAGMVPKPLAATLDSAIESAESHIAERIAANEAEREGSRFVQFALSAPAAMDAARFNAKLASLYETERAAGDARFVPRDDKSPTIYVRCRPWLETEIKESAELMSR